MSHTNAGLFTSMGLTATLALAGLLGAQQPVSDHAATRPASDIAAQEDKMLLEVPPVLAGAAQDTVEVNSTPEPLASRKGHQLTVGGKQVDGPEIAVRKWSARCEWVMATPTAGEYVVSLVLFSGDKRPGKFGYWAGDQEHSSAEFRGKGNYAVCTKAFRIIVPQGQTRTRMFITGIDVYLDRVDICKADRPLANEDGRIKELATSSYRTVIKQKAAAGTAPACVVLVPAGGVEANLAKALAERLGVPTAAEPALKVPLPAYPDVAEATSDTNLILLSAGVGGPLVQAMRRAGLIAEDRVVPGPGGYVIRTVARPFAGKANVIVISGGDEQGLAKAVAAFVPSTEGDGLLVYDKFLVDSPSERWKTLRDSRYRMQDKDKWWDDQMADLAKPWAGLGGYSPGRSYIGRTADCGNWYWLTGNDKFAELIKRYLFKMEEDGIFGGKDQDDSHMELYGLLRAWDRAEESPVFSAADRLRITNYLLLQCVEGNEGFLRAYPQYRGFSGPVRMRHNHQTILGCGLMQAYLYFRRLYGLGRADTWKAWCDDVIANATYWGHAPENSPNYEPRTFLETADMLHYQGLSSRGRSGTANWPAAAMRLLAVTDSFALPSAYGDCWDNLQEDVSLFEVMRDDWDWPAAQYAIDRLIRARRVVAPKAEAAKERFAYLRGSTDVGGLLPPPDEAKVREALQPLVGLAALPMTEGYWQWMTGQVGNKSFWDEVGRPERIPYAKTADKIQYRSGWGTEDEYLLLETLGWADHGHMDLGTIVQYCCGGRLWIVDYGYNNTGPEHHSTLEVRRDGNAAWGLFKGQSGRWGDFRAGPQMFEIVKLDPATPGMAGKFSIACRAKDLAGATWMRAVSGGDGNGLTIEDTLTAEKAGEFEVVFRLRLLGESSGTGGKWLFRQKGASLPVTLEMMDGDEVGIGKWMPDDHAGYSGAYPWYAFTIDGGIPKTLEWRRKIKLTPGQSTTFLAILGPPQKSE